MARELEVILQFDDPHKNIVYFRIPRPFGDPVPIHSGHTYFVGHDVASTKYNAHTVHHTNMHAVEH